MGTKRTKEDAIHFKGKRPKVLPENAKQPSLVRTDDNIRVAVKAWLEDEQEATRLYGHISDWDTSQVTNMERMFTCAHSFNQPLKSWDTSKVTTMEGMFWSASSFNQPLNSWRTSKVTNMMCMFHSATKFNEPLDHWDISSVPHKHENGLKDMFRGALAYEFSPLDPIDKSAYIWQSTKDDYIPGHICKR